MSVYLVGGGPDTVTDRTAVDQFLDECGGKPGGRARVAVVCADVGESAAYFFPVYAALLAREGVEPVLVPVGPEHPSPDLAGYAGIVVGGGPTPVYLDALHPVAGAIRTAVADGVPYLGFSAGAMIAPDRAIVGGWCADGRPVCPEEWSEGLDEVTVLDGLGLVRFAVDVHAAQAGTLSRAVAVVQRGVVPVAEAIDEDSTLVVRSDGSQAVLGRGRVWTVAGGPGAASVTVRTA
ncbi:Type 1 glutamine amidotransferase-like domain-containing protein [Antribacter gilvus]|uniref:Type 1 glutamine amidotransferase-like domain-containing protein n=1 Tax=Antribacter gilvus TaxID=2304675 RepID=UPI000F789609|nr:Type 1 glutamine amidotransferase-like domain-containing protein [Antribacter gilvus]